MAHKPTTIFINPRFKNAHINPNFLSNKIHINPNFLQHSNSFPVVAPVIPNVIQALPQQQQHKQLDATINPIIRNTRRTLIRVPAVSRPNVPVFSPQSVMIKEPVQLPYQQLIKISKNKLVTAAHLMKCQQKENEIIKNAAESIIKSKKLQRKATTIESVYKLDRRQSTQQKKKKVVSTYSIRRVDAITPKKMKLGHSSSNKMVNINGVLYKSTSNKLEKTSDKSEKLLIIRGEKFLLDPSGARMRRDSDSVNLKLSRIDIGGLTYKASQSGAFERDNSHQVRSHLSLAKMKSISFLARSSLQKSNIICPIYRRLGKCLAYANGRCNKVHDQRYVIVCPSFLRDSCNDEKCLLSHNANLHKMPVCKYFLQGLCQKQGDCRYLHKKLTDDTKLCAEFIKGYCPLAGKCKLLHDFPQLDQRDRRSFSIVRYKPKKKRAEKQSQEASNSVRYYIDESAGSFENVPMRGALGKLPSYIPL